MKIALRAGVKTKKFNNNNNNIPSREASKKPVLINAEPSYSQNYALNGNYLNTNSAQNNPTTITTAKPTVWPSPI